MNTTPPLRGYCITWDIFDDPTTGEEHCSPLYPRCRKVARELRAMGYRLAFLVALDGERLIGITNLED